MNTWLPTWKLSDGTCLFGPLTQQPKIGAAVRETELNGEKWYVAHTGDAIAPAMEAEFNAWLKESVAKVKAQHPLPMMSVSPTKPKDARPPS